MQALAERLDVHGRAAPCKRSALLSFSSLKTFSPPVEELYGQTLDAVTRRAKYLVWHFGRRVPDRPASLAGWPARCRVTAQGDPTPGLGGAFRFLRRLCRRRRRIEPRGEEAVLVREYGTQRKASWWVLAPGDDGPLEGLGPEPDSPAFAELIRTGTSTRRLHSELRDQRVVAGIGRGWGDDILHRARLSPFASLGSLDAEERERLLAPTTTVLTEALALERTRTGGLSEAKLGGRLAVHGRVCQPCPTPGCGDEMRRVSYESYEMTYCPVCQTGGKVLADRRLSRLLK